MVGVDAGGGPPAPNATHCQAYFSGYNFTWCNFQQNGTVVEERLDRFCVDTDWSLLFPNATVDHIDSDISDHLPILLKCSPCPNNKKAKKQSFMFENMWLTEPTCKDVITAAWSSVLGPNLVENSLLKLSSCAASLAE